MKDATQSPAPFHFCIHEDDAVFSCAKRIIQASANKKVISLEMEVHSELEASAYRFRTFNLVKAYVKKDLTDGYMLNMDTESGLVKYQKAADSDYEILCPISEVPGLQKEMIYFDEVSESLKDLEALHESECDEMEAAWDAIKARLKILHKGQTIPEKLSIVDSNFIVASPNIREIMERMENVLRGKGFEEGPVVQPEATVDHSRAQFVVNPPNDEIENSKPETKKEFSL